MHHYLLTLFICLIALFNPATCNAQSEPLDLHDSSKWKEAIQKFQVADSESPPAKNGTLFVGSSSIRRWDLNKYFPELDPINRGFGGSQLADSVQFMEILVLKHQPKTVVMYAGDNDLSKGKSPERVFADFAEFVAILQKRLPETQLHYIAVKPSLKRIQLIEKGDRTNRLIQTYCQMHPNLHFVDIATPMMTTGKPQADLFVEDLLHVNEKGYQMWAEIVKKSLLNAANSKPE